MVWLSPSVIGNEKFWNKGVPWKNVLLWRPILGPFWQEWISSVEEFRKKGRMTTLVSECVSRSRSSHFSGSHQPPPLHHWIRGGSGTGKGGQLVKHWAHSKHVCPVCMTIPLQWAPPDISQITSRPTHKFPSNNTACTKNSRARLVTVLSSLEANEKITTHYELCSFIWVYQTLGFGKKNNSLLMLSKYCKNYINLHEGIRGKSLSTMWFNELTNRVKRSGEIKCDVTEKDKKDQKKL